MKYGLGLCVLVMVSPCIAEGVNEAPKTGFADYLFKKGEFDRAITEYERVLYETHEAQPLKDQVLYKEALCYKGLGMEDRALEHQKRYLRFKADESAQAITGPYRIAHPEDNNERQSIHEHASAVKP